MYAAGKIPGSFFRREGRAGEKATLTARMIDRPLRPLFPKGWNRDTQLVSIPMSIDHEHPYDILAMNGASAALMVSDIPFPVPVGAVRIGQDAEGNFLVNPDEEWLLESPLDLVVAGTEEAILMVEAGANEITEAEILDALDIAHAEIKRLCEAQHDLRKQAGKEKTEIEPPQVDESIMSQIRERFGDALDAATQVVDKLERQDATKARRGGGARGSRHERRGRRGRRRGAPRRRAARLRQAREGDHPQAASPWTRSVPTAARRRRSATSGSRWGWGRARTAPRSSPAARRRPSRLPRSARRVTRCVSTRSASRRRSTTSTTTTSRRSRWARPASCAARSAATSATARSRSGRSCRSCRRWTSSPTRSAWCRTSSSRTARARWPRSAARRCR